MDNKRNQVFEEEETTAKTFESWLQYAKAPGRGRQRTSLKGN